MKFDQETWDNIYDIPAELAPVIEELTVQNNSMKEALKKIRDITVRVPLGYLPDNVAWSRVMLSMIKEIQDVVEPLR